MTAGILPFFPLILLSVGLLALIGWRAREMSDRRRYPAAAGRLFLTTIPNGTVPTDDEWQEAALVQGGPVAAVVQEGRRLMGRPADEAAEAFRRAAARELSKVKGWNGWLSYAARVGPLLALFTCVLALVGTFSAVTGEAGQSAQLAKGISVALLPTVLGVLLAVIGETAAQFFNHRLLGFATRLDGEIEQFARHVSCLKPPTEPTGGAA